MIEGKKVPALSPKNWKKSSDSGIIIPTKMRFCNECSGERMCDKCINQVNENKVFEAKSILLKRESPNQFGHMLPYYKI